MNKLKGLSILLLICLFTGFLAGCAPQNAAQPTSAPAPAATVAAATDVPAPVTTVAPEKKTKTITDMKDRKVEVPLEINRIVVAPACCNIPGILSALGSGDKVVSGVCFNRGPEDIQFKVQPNYANLELVAGSDYTVDTEKTLTLNPDIIISGPFTDLDAVAQAGIPAVAINYSTYEQLRGSFTMLGEALNKPERAAQIVAAMDRIAKQIQDKVSTIPEDKRKKVIALTKTNPITVMGGPSHSTFMAEMTGAVNAMKDAPEFIATVSMEQVLIADPDIIFVSAVCPKCRDEILQSSAWQALRAVKEKKVYVFPRGVFFWDKPAVELSLGLLWETYIQYPDLISEADVIGEAKQFYRDFFNYDITDQDIKWMFFK